MIMLFDYDSMFYKAVSHIVSRSDIRIWFEDGKTKDWMKKEIVNLTINRLQNMQDNMFEYIEMSQGWDFEVEYFMTTNHLKCKRREVYPDYKLNRKQTKKGKKRVNVLSKWVKLVQKEYLSFGHCKTSEYWEADDLIADRKRELGDDCFIASIDKDLKQLGGLFFDYYQEIEKDEDGYVVLNSRTGYPIKNYRGFDFVYNKDAEKMKWVQVLMGDTTDNIPGLKGVGVKTANKLLDGVQVDVMDIVVKGIYLEKSTIESYYLNKFLIELGTNRQLQRIIENQH